MAGRRQGQRETGQHDEHDDREAPVDEPAGPERRVVDRVAAEGAQKDVVDDHVQRGQAAEAVEAGQAPLGLRDMLSNRGQLWRRGRVRRWRRGRPRWFGLDETQNAAGCLRICAQLGHANRVNELAGCGP